MKTVLIDGAALVSKEQLHHRFACELAFPPHYGGNLDALFDCLCDIAEPVEIILRNVDALELRFGGYARALTQLLHRATLENPHLTVEIL